MAIKWKMFEVTQQIEYYKDYKERIEQIASKEFVTDMAYCVHDRDLLENWDKKAPHVHIMIRLNNNYSLAYIAKIMGVPEQYVIKSIRWSFCLMVQYLTHKNDLNKYQYDYDKDVVKVKWDIDIYYYTDVDKYITKNAKSQTYEIDKTFTKSFYEQQKEIMSMDITDSKKIRILKNLDELYAYYLSDVKREERLEVVYIEWTTWTWKTTFAKYIAEKMGFKYFISQADVWLFEWYKWEEVIILDDFRDSHIKFSTLLKVLDNYNSSVVGARYKNINISKAKVIILTSTIPLASLYDWIKFLEDRRQLYRRIDKLFCVNKTWTINIWEEIDAVWKGYWKYKTFKNPLEEIKKANKEKKTYIDLDKILL